MTRRHIRALALISDTGMNGISIQVLNVAVVTSVTIRQLLADGLIKTRDHTFANPAGLVVPRYHLTDAGHNAAVNNGTIT